MLRSLAAFLTRSGRHDEGHHTGARPPDRREPQGGAGDGTGTDAARRDFESRLAASWSGESRLTRLRVPSGIPVTLGCDAVGVPARYGFRLLARLPRNGCVFADSHWWWWIVPAGSDLGLTWPLPSHYARGARVPATSPRLVGPSDNSSPYTPPIPLYLMTCQLTGTAPLWPVRVGTGRP
ncbi:hypothetical protein OHS70_03900 [Streptomyces sp. NBC_00390]|uniref:hypothetical protein n=1 Tax=Streptomyces sp. NBC_00390 TaxID=2975736 RepID=UPI002E2290C6